MIEDDLFTGPWVMGPQYTVADAYLFTITQWLPAHRIESSTYPKVHGHQKQMLGRPAVQLAITAESQDYPAR
jgi:glutathione S-transferase